MYFNLLMVTSVLISGLNDSPDENHFSKVRKLVQQFIDERVIKVVIRAGGAERHQDSSIGRPLEGDDVFVDLVSSLRVDLQDVHVHYCHHWPEDGHGFESSGLYVTFKDTFFFS